MTESLLCFDGVRFAYGDGAWSLDVPSLALGGDRCACIVGPNGSGKSTLLRLAAGLLPPGRGAVLLDGRPLASHARRSLARRVGFLPQESPSLFDFPVEAVVRMGRYAHLGRLGLPSERDERAVESALASVGMEDLRRRPLSRLSGGERRRALIASVLAQEPELLLLDEPTAALDIHHAASVMRLLSGFGRSGPAVVAVTHDINLAALFGERLLLLAGGRLCADGPPAEVVTEEVLGRTYGEGVLVRDHPETGGPLVVPRRAGRGGGGCDRA